MSFSSETKNELAQIIPDRNCCKLAEISGIMRMCGTIRLYGKGKVTIKLLTENPAVARKIIKLLKAYFGIKVDLLISKNAMLKKNHSYELTISEEMRAEEILRETGILSVKDGYNFLDYAVPEKVLKSKCCKKAFLRGAFLGSGSLSDPEKIYHLEMVSSNLPLCESIKSLMSQLGLSAKIVERKKNYVIYLKESEQVIDFLNIIGAYNALLEYENVRIVKDMRNKTNRLVNCDSANMDKTLDAAEKQIMAIEKIIEKKGLDWLQPRLQEVAQLRLDNRELSIKELGEMLDPPLGKSGINHRLKKIEELAEQL